MKKLPLYILFIVLMNATYSQIGPNDANALIGLPNATDLTEINAILTPQIGSVVYNLADDQIYRFTSSGWQVVSGENIYNTDGALSGERTVDMAANQLNFDTSVDSRTTLTLRRTNNANSVGIAFRNSGNAYPATIVMGSGSSGNSNGLDFYTGGNDGNAGNLTKTLALQNDNQIELSEYGETPINFEGTSTAVKLLGVEADGGVVEVNTVSSSRIFYPPSIAIDASTVSANPAAPGDESVNLYQQYLDQFTLANAATSASSAGAPGTLPTYLATELYYYVTFFDPAVFANVAIDANGVMTYDIIGTPLDFNSLINVVFVVR